jgi:methyl-accepting chemotaxis protein
MFVVSIVLINVGIGIYSVNSMKQKVLGAAQEKLKSDAAMGNALLNKRFPGNWSIKEGSLYKGAAKMNDNFDMVDEIGELTGDTVTIFQGDTRVATNVIDQQGNRAVNTQAADAVKDSVLVNGKTYIGKANVVGVWNQTVYEPIRNANGEIIGIWYVGIPNTVYDQLAAEFRNMLILFSAIAILLVSIIVWVITDRMTRPLVMLEKVTNKVAAGDLTQNIAEINSKDEIGSLAIAFGKMINNMRDVLSKIASASEEVALGSKNIASSSASLSAGATDQTGSIEELTASISMIANQVRTNGQSVNQSIELVENAELKVDHGYQEMKNMLLCMDDIDESSQNIGKVIKVINDIAFQTNVLALNAGVEAARAGEYGKGFAVVAGEVRSLAMRSAEAAKQTGQMIEASSKNVEMGISVANKMSSALEGIRVSIGEVESLVGAIGLASDRQIQSIDEFNAGITKIGNVVHSNSAMSEETAAASEELFNQAEILKQEATRFTLR